MLKVFRVQKTSASKRHIMRHIMPIYRKAYLGIYMSWTMQYFEVHVWDFFLGNILAKIIVSHIVSVWTWITGANSIVLIYLRCYVIGLWSHQLWSSKGSAAQILNHVDFGGGGRRHFCRAHYGPSESYFFWGYISYENFTQFKLPENLYRFWSKQNDEDEALCNFAEHIMVLQNHICFGGIALTKILHKVPVTYGETLLEVHNSKHHSSTRTWFTPFTSNSHLKFHIFPWKYMSWAFHIYRRNVKSHQGSKIMIFQN